MDNLYDSHHLDVDTNINNINEFISANIHYKLLSYPIFNLANYIYNDFTNRDMIKTEFLQCININKSVEIDDKPIEIDDTLIIHDCNSKLTKNATDFVIQTFFPGNTIESQKNIYYLQYLINNIFNNIVNNIIIQINSEGGKLKNTDIIFLYKGGTTLKILYDTYKDYFTKIENDYFYSLFSENFTRSDSDYVIMINPNINMERNNVTFDYVYRLVNYNVTLYLYNISSFIQKELFINRDLITNEKLDNFIDVINTTIQELKETRPECQKYRNIGNIFGVGYFGISPITATPGPIFYSKDKSIHTDRNLYKNFNKNIMIISNIDGDNKICFQNKNLLYNIIEYNQNVDDILTDIEFSINDTINIFDKTNTYILDSFCLQRLKLKFIFYYMHEHYGLRSIPCRGELIDIVILKQNSHSLHEFYSVIDNPELKKYTIYQFNNLHYYSYTMNGHIYDLIYILFDVSDYPWNDNKFEKRINRLTFLLILDLYNNIITSTNDIDRNNNISKILFMLKLFNDIDNIFIQCFQNEQYDIHRITQELDRCIYLINQYNMLFDNYIFTYKLKELFEKIKINYTKDLFNKLYHLILLFNIKFVQLNIYIPNMIQSRVDDVIHVTQLGGKYNKKYLKYKLKYVELKKKFNL